MRGLIPKGKLADLRGRKFGNLEVISSLRGPQWKCRCVECGNEFAFTAPQLQLPGSRCKCKTPKPEKETPESVAREDEARRAKKFLAPLQDTLRALYAEYGKLWSLPIERFSQMSADSLYIELGLEKSDRATPFAEIKAAVNKFATELSGRTGFTLDSQNGVKRLLIFVVVQHDIGHVTPTQESIQACFDFLCRHSFGDDVGHDPSLKVKQEPAPKQSKSFDELLATTDVYHDEQGDRDLQAAVRDRFTGQASEFAGQWASSLYKNFGHRLSDYEVDFIYSWFSRTGRSPLDARNFDMVRVLMAKQNIGGFSAALLTGSEALALEFESGALPFGAYRQKERELVARGLASRPRHEAGV